MGYVVKNEFIKKRRQALSMTQVMFANKAKISQGYVSAIERGRVKTVGLKTVLKLANALNVHYNTLIDATEAKVKSFYVTIPIDNDKTIEVALNVETAPQYDQYRAAIQRVIRDVISAHEELILREASIPFARVTMQSNDEDWLLNGDGVVAIQ